MDAIALFCALAAQRGKVSARHYSKYAAYGHLITAGLVTETGVVGSVLCDECDQPHDAQVVYENGQYGYYCPDLGFMPMDRSGLTAAKPDFAKFVAALANALNCQRRKTSPVLGETWRIGAIDTHGGDLVIYMHPTLQHAQDIEAVATALGKEMNTRFCLILTACGALSVEGVKTALLTDVVTFDVVSGDLNVLVDLSVIVDAPVKRKGGRPSNFQTPLHELILERQNSGAALSGRNAEAKAVLAEFIEKYPNIHSPSLPTVKRYITNS